MKYVTFSYDDGVTQDVRLIEMFNKYGLKCTFNINSELLGTGIEIEREGKIISHVKNNPSDVKKIYEGHEVAVHTLTHPNLTETDDAEIIRQVNQDRENLSDLVGYQVYGMAYPCGGVNNNDHVAQVIRDNTPIKFARTITSSHSFDKQTNLLRFNPTVYHHEEWDKMFALAEMFIAMSSTDKPQIFYIWGHSYEFDIHDTWDRMEQFCKLISGKEDVFYGTNSQVLLR